MKHFFILSSFLVLTYGMQVHAENKGKSLSMPTTEERAKMADVHEKMAQCLRSEKPMKDCRAEMRKSCEETMGEKRCMMGHGKHWSDWD